MYRYTIKDVEYITHLYKMGFTPRDINPSYAAYRRKAGTGTKREDYTNFISQLSPQSKHRQGKMHKIATAEYSGGVIETIMFCLKCSEKEARRIYNTRVVPVCRGGFYSQNEHEWMTLYSVRYFKPACASTLYFIYSTEEMGPVGSDSPGDVWTYKSDSTFRDLIDGTLDEAGILAEINQDSWGVELVDVRAVKL